jgi:hypothetical protein
MGDIPFAHKEDGVKFLKKCFINFCTVENLFSNMKPPSCTKLSRLGMLRVFRPEAGEEREAFFDPGAH